MPPWTTEHQLAFDGIKELVSSRECLTVIDHVTPGDNKIFVTTDASDFRTGAVLSWGPTWETARPVAFDSVPLTSAQLNYPVHEKELLAIIHALNKWRSDLLGSNFTVFTDHRTLENFDRQRDLLRRQARWMELMSQYDFTINYIRGEDNTIADALSRLPVDPASDPVPDVDPEEQQQPLWSSWMQTSSVNSVLHISADKLFLSQLKAGYLDDTFCKKFVTGQTILPNVRNVNGLWYIGDRLLIPRTGDLHEQLFRLAHDSLSHGGTDKAYATLRDAYYWPNMHCDLESSYIPACQDCMHNKSPTSKPSGPLHPLPVPENHGDSVAIDFIGPLPEDQGFNCIVTFTDHLNSDIRLVPTWTDISAADFASIFFNEWYCENGLPLNIVSDRDKLFISKFWKSLHELTGVKLNMSTSFHPESDGASERTNKTVNQAIRFHVDRNQKGWVHALPVICFNMMNTVNASTGFSGFQLRMGRSPRLIPPLVPDRLPVKLDSDFEAAANIIKKLNNDTCEAADNILAAKISQAHQANKHHSPDPTFALGDRVMLSTMHQRRDFQAGHKDRVAKFMPRFDGPYTIVETHC